MTTLTGKTGASKVPNVFILQACLGNKADAAKAWVMSNPRLNGLSPAEAWDNPEVLLSPADREANPTAGPLTLATMRSKIIRIVKSGYNASFTLTADEVPIPSFAELMTEAEAPLPESGPESVPEPLMPYRAPRRTPLNGNGHGGHAAVSKLVEDIRRRKASRKFR